MTDFEAGQRLEALKIQALRAEGENQKIVQKFCTSNFRIFRKYVLQAKAEYINC